MMVQGKVGNVPAGWMEDTLKRPTVAGGAPLAG